VKLRQDEAVAQAGRQEAAFPSARSIVRPVCLLPLCSAPAAHPRSATWLGLISPRAEHRLGEGRASRRWSSRSSARWRAKPSAKPPPPPRLPILHPSACPRQRIAGPRFFLFPFWPGDRTTAVETFTFPAEEGTSSPIQRTAGRAESIQLVGGGTIGTAESAIAPQLLPGPSPPSDRGRGTRP